jgi:hypothetical protein
VVGGDDGDGGVPTGFHAARFDPVYLCRRHQRLSISATTMITGEGERGSDRRGAFLLMATRSAGS